MMGRCRLCQKKRELKKSHIVPRFIFVWLKEKTGATPFLREIDNPDERIQDIKEELLCGECEQRLNRWESKFASNVFYPFIRDQKDQIEYGEWFKKFIISVSWRLIVTERTDIEGFDSPHRENLKKVEEEWRQILMESSDLKDESRSHYFCSLKPLMNEEGDVPDGSDFYLGRSIDAEPITIFGTYIYCKLPQMFFVSCVDPIESPGLTNCEVKDEGVINTDQQIGPFWETVLQARIDLIAESTISDSEREKIYERMKDNPEVLMESDTLKTFARKYNRDRKNHDPREYLDEKCPVCGFEHKVVESLPKHPITDDIIQKLRGSESVKYVNSVGLNDKRSAYLDQDSVQGAVILSTKEKTRVLAFYNDIGYIVEEEILYSQNDVPREVGRDVHKQVKALYEDAVSDPF